MAEVKNKKIKTTASAPDESDEKIQKIAADEVKKSKRGRKKINLEDIPGVGKKIAEKLTEVGFTDLMAIAVASPAELALIAEVGEGQSRKINIPLMSYQNCKESDLRRWQGRKFILITRSL